MTDDRLAARYLRIGGLEINQMPDGWVIYRQETDRVHFLNPTAALVFELCNGRHTVADIGAILSGAYALSAPTTDEVSACLANLAGEGLVTPCSSSPSEP